MHVHCSQLKYVSAEERDRAKIRRYAAENGATMTTRHFAVPETTRRRLKSEWSHHFVTSSRSETRNLPNLKPAKCYSCQICQICPPIFTATQYICLNDLKQFLSQLYHFLTLYHSVQVLPITTDFHFAMTSLASYKMYSQIQTPRLKILHMGLEAQS